MRVSQRLASIWCYAGCTVAMVTALAIPAHSASTEVWVCGDRGPVKSDRQPAVVSMSLADGLLIAQPQGAPRYRILANTDHAIVAVDYYGDFDPVLGTVLIFVSSLTIDKSSSKFMLTTTSTNGVDQQTGQCRKFDEPTTLGITNAAP
jgi:hypothetical protein